MILNKTVHANIRTWSNKLNGTNDLMWIYANHEKISELIEQYENINTKKTHYISLSNVMKKLRKTKLQTLYINKAIELNKEHTEQQLDQQPVHNIVEFKTIEHVRDALDGYTSLKDNLLHLILSLYTYRPPLRNDYGNMRIVSKLPKGKKNYLLKQNNGFTIVLRDYKTYSTYGEYISKLPDILDVIINKSLVMYPRKYLLSLMHDPNKPLTKQNVKRYLSDLNLNVDILRSSYVTYIYNKRSTTNRIKKELSKDMLHSQQMASTTYHKIV